MRTREWLAIPVALLGTSTASAAGPVVGLGDPAVPHAGNPGYDVVGYDWQFEVDPEAGTLHARAAFDAEATASSDEITLDYLGAPLDWVRVDGVDAEHSYASPKLVIDTDTVEGEPFTVEVGYSGTPERAVAAGRVGRFGWIAQNGVIHNETVLPGDMAAILPLNDTPLDPATWTLAVTVPDPYVVTASGELIDRSGEAGRSTFVWQVDLPVSEFKFAIGRFVTEPIDVTADLGVDVSVTSSADDPVDLEDFESVPEVLAFLVERLGPFPFEQVGFTMIDGMFAAGDSSPGRIHLAFVSEIQLVHELCHQWMGGSVGTASSRDSWLREGLCRYLELLWLDEQGTAELETSVAEIRELLGAETRPPLEITSSFDRMDMVTYERGALAFHALRNEVGDDQFWMTLQQFFAQLVGQSATTDDFVAVAETVTGEDLDDVFDAWLSQSAVPPP